MKKLFTILAAMLLVVGVTGCQKPIVATINYSDGDNAGGMQAEMKQNSTLKDLFDELGKGTEFVYEVDDQGNLVSINGKANDEAGNWEITVNGQAITDTLANIKLNEGDVCDIKYVATETSTPVLGGWQVAEIAREELTDEEKQDFTKATETLLGVTYEPVCVLAQQLVNGTNYAYLAKGTTVTATPTTGWYIVKVYKDLQGNVSANTVTEINLTDLQTREDSNEEIVGGWEVLDTGKPGSLSSEQAQASFDKAVEGLVGVGYNPIQLLATQVVSGTNYMALLRGKVVAPDTPVELYVMTWYEDLNGNSTVTEIKKLDLNYYVQ